MATLNVIKSVQQKDSLGSYNSPVYIGVEQRFVTALRQSNNNNLEEQSILGLECITTEYIQKNENNKNVQIIKKEYRTSDRDNNYYVLEIENYDITSNLNTHFDEEAETLVIAGQKETVKNEIFTDVRKETLSYINNEKVKQLISTKIVQKKVENGVITTREVITNNLK